jgi:hypothetical protein
MSDETPMPATPPEPAYRVPSHGKGRLRVIRPGESGNPSGLSGRYGEVVRLARQASPEAMRAMIEIMRNPDEETRARIVAIEGILNRAFGRPREMQPDAPAPLVDVNRMSEVQLGLLIEALRLAKAARSTTPPAEPQPEGEPEPPAVSPPRSGPLDVPSHVTPPIATP